MYLVQLASFSAHQQFHWQTCSLNFTKIFVIKITDLNALSFLSKLLSLSMLTGQQIISCVMDSTLRSLLFVTSTSCVTVFFAESGYSVTWNRRVLFTSEEKITLTFYFLPMLKGFLTSADILVAFSIFPEKIPPLLLMKKQRTNLSPSVHSMADAKSNIFLAH